MIRGLFTLLTVASLAAATGAGAATPDPRAGEASLFMNAQLLTIEGRQVTFRDNDGARRTLSLGPGVGLEEPRPRSGDPVIVAIGETDAGAPVILALRTAVPASRTVVSPGTIPVPDTVEATVAARVPTESVRVLPSLGVRNGAAIVPPVVPGAGAPSILLAPDPTSTFVTPGGAVPGSSRFVTRSRGETVVGGNAGTAGTGPVIGVLGANTVELINPSRVQILPPAISSTATGQTVFPAPSTRAAPARRTVPGQVVTPQFQGTGTVRTLGNGRPVSVILPETLVPASADQRAVLFPETNPGAVPVDVATINAATNVNSGLSTQVGGGAFLQTATGSAAVASVGTGSVTTISPAVGTLSSATTVGSPASGAAQGGGGGSSLGSDAQPNPAAVEALEAAVARLATQAEYVDHAWALYRQACIGSTSSPGGTGSRNWTGLWDGGAPPSETRDQCEPLLNAAVNAGRTVQQGMQMAEDAARRSSVLPGTVRQIRSMYGMDWNGWDR